MQSGSVVCDRLATACVNCRSSLSLSFPSCKLVVLTPSLIGLSCCFPPGEARKDPSKGLHVTGAQEGGPRAHFTLGSTTHHPSCWDHVPASSEGGQARPASPLLPRPRSPLGGRYPRVPGADEGVSGAAPAGQGAHCPSQVSGPCVGNGRSKSPPRATGHGDFNYHRHSRHLRREPVLPISHQGSLPTVQL